VGEQRDFVDQHFSKFNINLRIKEDLMIVAKIPLSNKKNIFITAGSSHTDAGGGANQFYLGKTKMKDPKTKDYVKAMYRVSMRYLRTARANYLTYRKDKDKQLFEYGSKKLPYNIVRAAAEGCRLNLTDDDNKERIKKIYNLTDAQLNTVSQDIARRLFLTCLGIESGDSYIKLYDDAGDFGYTMVHWDDSAGVRSIADQVRTIVSKEQRSRTGIGGQKVGLSGYVHVDYNVHVKPFISTNARKDKVFNLLRGVITFIHESSHRYCDAECKQRIAGYPGGAKNCDLNFDMEMTKEIPAFWASNINYGNVGLPLYINYTSDKKGWKHSLPGQRAKTADCLALLIVATGIRKHGIPGPDGR